jgi:alkanesulfonate monooxygenase SsuD/methylene tetrahydromethanopterin reductase-like flavin-dependent oxidoreductase (luciferase family)
MRTTMEVGEAFMNPPGYMSAKGNASWLQKNQVRGRAGNHLPATTKDGRVINQAQAPLADLVSANVLFCGTPDDVYEQITDFCDAVGGIGHMLLMMHGGPMSHEDAKANIGLFAKEVMPRLKKHYDYTGSRQPAVETA